MILYMFRAIAGRSGPVKAAVTAPAKRGALTAGKNRNQGYGFPMFKGPLRALPPLLLALVLAGAGCRTFESRAQEKAAVFQALDPQTQNRLRTGIIAVGDTTDMVYIALGRPDEIRELRNADGSTQAWIYNNYYSRFEGTATVGYRRDLVYDPGAKTYRAYLEPVRQDVYSSHKEERFRVTFKEGRVSVIEQKKG
jgi:hypothetical protein